MSETIPEPKKDPPAKPNPTVKSVATLAGIVVGSAVLVGAFALGGPLIAAGAAAAVAGGGYVRHRVKNPKRSTGRKLPWPLTGSQKSRALSLRGKTSKLPAIGNGSGRGGRKSRSSSGRSGLSGPKAPTGRGKFGLPMTTRSRARRSAGGVLPKHKASRTVSSRTAKPLTSAGKSKPSGLRLPKTSSRTPAKPSAARRLMPSSRRAPSSKRSGSNLRGSTRKGGSSTRGHGRSPSGQARRSPTRSPFASTARRLNPLRKTSPSGKHSRRVNPFKRPTGLTGSSRRLTGATPSRRAGLTTKRARRLGTPKTSPNRSPNRTAKRITPYKRAPARSLLRKSIGLPERGRTGKLVQPTKVQRKRARRTLQLRGLTRVAAVRKLPAMAAHRWWDTQYGRVPATPDPQWTVPTVPQPKAKVAAGKRHLTAIPSPTQEVRSMSVSEAVSDAFAQIASFEADGASEVERLIIDQPELFKTIGQHYATLADRMSSEMPFDPSVSDAMRDFAAAVSAVGQVAEQVHETMRAVHEPDFARTETPRPNEGMWNPENQ